jgi:hypothetical protein
MVERPAHGTLGNAGYDKGRFLAAYRPNPDYVGEDEFAVRLTYVLRDQRRSFSTTVHMRMR